MNYLRISNEGLICPEDLTLIGSSTKREQSGKIGMFGSGWKYALAWLLRNDTKPMIFAGDMQIHIDFTVKMHRANAINIITVNDIETSLTTEMGPKWTGWMAIREILSNAIDEGGHTINTVWSPSEFKGVNGETVIFIPMNGELSDVMLKFDSYFAFYRKASWQNEHVKMFFKTEISQMNIYRKGIRCFDTTNRTKVDFDFDDIHISEDRLTSDFFINEKVRSIMRAGLPTHIVKRILLEENSNWLPSEMNEGLLQNMIDLINDGHTFTTPTLQKLGGMLFSMPDALVISADWFKRLQDLGLVKSPFEFFGGDEHFIRTDAKDLKGINYYLSSMNIKATVYSGRCESDVFVYKGIIYVKDDTKETDKIIAAKAVKRMSIDDIMAYMV